MKGVGMLVGKFELNPKRRPIWAWPNKGKMRNLGLYEWGK